MDIQTVFLLADFPTNIAIGETTAGEKEYWRRHIDSSPTTSRKSSRRTKRNEKTRSVVAVQT